MDLPRPSSSHDAEAIISHIIPVLAKYGLRILGAIVILVAGWIAAGLVARLTRRAMARHGLTIPFPQRDVHLLQSPPNSS